MEIRSDILLTGDIWDETIEKLKPIFNTRTNYMLYILAISVGIVYDKKIESLPASSQESKSVPRMVIHNNDNGRLDYLFQAAILNTDTIVLSEKERLELAFNDKSDYDKVGLLTQFANFGIGKIHDQIGSSEEETMQNIKDFLSSTVDGTNFDIDDISDDILVSDDD